MGRVSAIARVIEFLRQCNHLSTEFSELKAEIFSTSTFTLIRKILPRDYMEKVNDTIVDVTASTEQKMLTIKRFLKDRKTSALMGVDTSKGSRKPKDDENQPKPKLDPLSHRNLSFPMSPKHLCTKSYLCKPDWGSLGAANYTS